MSPNLTFNSILNTLLSFRYSHLYLILLYMYTINIFIYKHQNITLTTSRIIYDRYEVLSHNTLFPPQPISSSSYLGLGYKGRCSCSSYVPSPSSRISKLLPYSHTKRNLELYLILLVGWNLTIIGIGNLASMLCLWEWMFLSTSESCMVNLEVIQEVSIGRCWIIAPASLQI